MVPHIAQTIQGTVNDDSDTDTGWIIEAAVRFSDYPELSKRPAPVPGELVVQQTAVDFGFFLS